MCALLSASSEVVSTLATSDLIEYQRLSIGREDAPAAEDGELACLLFCAQIQPPVTETEFFPPCTETRRFKEEKDKSEVTENWHHRKHLSKELVANTTDSNYVFRNLTVRFHFAA